MSVENPRRLVILRHAKADWPDVPDHERPLAERGRRDAPVAGRWLAEHGHQPDLTLCSTAARTRETWKLVAPELPRRPRTQYEDAIYEASPGELLALLNRVDDAVGDLLLIGHNPGMHGLADALAGRSDNDALQRFQRGGFPTAAIAVLTLPGGWGSAEHGAGTLVDYWTPRGRERS
jgi:phosphohistidine phosphatase